MRKKLRKSDAIIMDIPMPEAAPWDALMDQAASGNVPGNDENISPVADWDKTNRCGKNGCLQRPLVRRKNGKTSAKQRQKRLGKR